MADGDLPEHLAAADLCRLCREHTARYRRGEPRDDGYCYHVFRRAVLERDDTCWREMLAIYHDQVLGWCRKAGAGPTFDLDELVLVTWEKFLRSYTADKLAGSDGLLGIFAYLKLCARSAVLDEMRRHQPVPLDEGIADPADRALSPADAFAEAAARESLWQLINGLLRNERERVYMHLRYELGLRPAEIQARRPDLFPSATDVYRTGRNVYDRLKRSPDLRRWLEEDGS